MHRPAVEYVPSGVGPISVQKGEPAPDDGWWFSHGDFLRITPCVKQLLEKTGGAEVVP